MVFFAGESNRRLAAAERETWFAGRNPLETEALKFGQRHFEVLFCEICDFRPPVRRLLRDAAHSAVNRLVVGRSREDQIAFRDVILVVHLVLTDQSSARRFIDSDAAPGE